MRVDVTGTNIRRVDTETQSPVIVLTADDLVKSGYTTVAEVLRDITANGQGLLSQGFQGAFAAGASGVALRGLSLGATLVLVDGLRMVAYPLSDDGQRNFVDTSSIPFTAIERVEVLLDGASAIYGSDAIGGVVNFILKKNAEGVLLTAEGGAPFASGGGTNYHASITTGFGDTSSTFSGFFTAEYRKQDSIKPPEPRRQGLGAAQLDALRRQRPPPGRVHPDHHHESPRADPDTPAAGVERDRSYRLRVPRLALQLHDAAGEPVRIRRYGIRSCRKRRTSTSSGGSAGGSAPIG